MQHIQYYNRQEYFQGYVQHREVLTNIEARLIFTLNTTKVRTKENG